MMRASWQKLEATRVFVLCRLDFILRGARLAKGPLTRLDHVINRLAKEWM